MPCSSDDSDANSEFATPKFEVPAQPRVLFNEVDYGHTSSIALKSLASKPSLQNHHGEPREKLEQNSRETIVRTRSEIDLPDEGDASQTSRRRKQRRVLRSHSDAALFDYKNEWGAAIMSQEPVQDSFTVLRESVRSYETVAEKQKWKDILEGNKDITHLKRAVEAALREKHPKRHKSKVPDMIDQFSTVALEYSKLLDVVMSQAPEYVTLAWGAMKILLVANVNHARLKKNVEKFLIHIGNQFGLVNQLTCYSPTEEMVEAVAKLYANFSKFLGQALKYYAEHKLTTAVKAFTFPWEARFAELVTKMDEQFKRIRHLAAASHFRIALQNQELIRSIKSTQQELRDEVRRGTEGLRDKLENTIKELIIGSLQTFEPQWLRKFEDLIGEHESLAADFSSTKTDVALAEYTISPGELDDFQNIVFPDLRQFSRMDEYVRMRNRYLTAYDYHECVKLLRREEMKHWISSEASNLLWVNSHRLFGRVDWMTAFTTRLIDHAADADHITILRYFCKQQTTISTGLILIKSLIFQVVERHRKHFSVKSRQFTLRRFQAAADEFEELWALFLDLLGAAKLDCVWILIDHIDMLLSEPSSETSEDTLAFLNGLNELADDKNIIVKVLVTARHGGASNSLSASLTERKILSSRHAIITIPRGRQRAAATLWAKRSRKPHRLPDHPIGTDDESLLSPVPPESILFDPLRRHSNPQGPSNPIENDRNSTKDSVGTTYEYDSDCSDTVTPATESNCVFSSDDSDCADPNNGCAAKRTLHVPKTVFTLGRSGNSSDSDNSSDFIFGRSDDSDSAEEHVGKPPIKAKSTAQATPGSSDDSDFAERHVDKTPVKAKSTIQASPGSSGPRVEIVVSNDSSSDSDNGF